MQDPITYFAETDSRNKLVKFGIKAEDRTRHIYVIGKTGMGKSTLLENMAVQDIQSGNGLAFIDPHGKTADLLLEYVPKERIKDVIYFAPFDLEHPISFNVMEDVGYDRRHLVVSGLMSAFKKIWVDAWSARMEYILNNIILALLEFPDSTLIGVNRMLADKDYRNMVIANVTDPSVKSFWLDEFNKYSDKFMVEAGAAIQNKIGQFISNPMIRNIIGQPKSSFDLRQVMDDRKILIINLSKGRVGESNANLLGSMLVTKIYLAAMSRADAKGAIRHLPNFYLYVDEFQNFANESFASILSEARKYKLNLTIAHQYIEQMSEEVRAAVFGNVGTMITFRVGALDAEILEREFAPLFTATDLVNLSFAQIYLKLMIDGQSSQPFSARTLPPITKSLVAYTEQIFDASREQFSQPRAQVEKEIREWHAPIDTRRPPQERMDSRMNERFGPQQPQQQSYQQQQQRPPQQSQQGYGGGGGRPHDFPREQRPPRNQNQQPHQGGQGEQRSGPPPQRNEQDRRTPIHHERTDIQKRTDQRNNQSELSLRKALSELYRTEPVPPPDGSPFDEQLVASPNKPTILPPKENERLPNVVPPPAAKHKADLADALRQAGSTPKSPQENFAQPAKLEQTPDESLRNIFQ